MSTTRSDDDSWDIASSVGTTAVMVAAARAAETGSIDPLLRDPFAEPLVSTPELAELRANVASSWVKGPDGEDQYQYMVTYQAVRTHFFDAYFESAVASTIRQVVILAAGLDSRSYRLDWPDGTVVYELDLPKVLAYKASTLAAHGAKPVTTRREVAVDLRHDWPKALRDAGFDPAQPTAWLAEGLLPFLTGPAQDVMFERINLLSAAGSRIAVEAFGVDTALKVSVDKHRARVRSMHEQKGEDAGFDPGDLWYGDDGRSDASEWFAVHGWTTDATDSRDEAVRLGRHLEPSPDDDAPFFATFVVAAKS
jgi:methyltransferase (TIGR00027 family)